MWQRFSENARRIVFYAQEHAARLGTTTVSTEHLLLGLLQEAGAASGVWPPPPLGYVDMTNSSAFVLQEIGTDLATLREELERQVTVGHADLAQDMNLDAPSKHVIDFAYDEARRFRHNYIGPEHLLLGLIRERNGLAGRVLAQMGVELAAAQAVVAHLPPCVKTAGQKGPTFWQELRLLIGWPRKK